MRINVKSNSYIVIIIWVVLVAGLVIGLALGQVWEYLLGVFTEFTRWFGALVQEIVMDIRKLELYIGRKIESENTLLIFDEVQEVPKALSSLKYFYENAPQYHIICAGSLLGIALHGGTSFPVGKVNFLKLYPLCFKEFLIATDNERFVELLDKCDYQMITSFKQTYIDALKQYYFIGGMPEAVLSFVEEKNFNEVREIQKRILSAYEQDFSKHAPNGIVPKIRMLWNSIPSQLSKENKKFIVKQEHPRL